MKMEDNDNQYNNNNEMHLKNTNKIFISIRDYFYIYPEVKKAQCNFCKIIIKDESFNLNRHVRRTHLYLLHSHSLEKYPNSRNKLLIQDLNNINQNNDINVVEPSNSIHHTKKAKKIKGKTDESILNWLFYTDIPYCIIKNSYFKDFYSLLDSRYHIPSEDKYIPYINQTDNQLMNTVTINNTLNNPFMIAYYIAENTGNINKPILLNNYKKPTLYPGEAFIQILRAGICGTDKEICCGYSQFKGIPGHEFVGRVIKVYEQDENNLKFIGKRVVGEINISCNKCHTCLDNTSKEIEIKKRNHCPNRQCLGIRSKDGAFAEYITLPIVNLHILPDSIPDSHAIFVEPLAAAYRIIEQNIIDPSKYKVIVFGDGRLGLLVTEVLVKVMKLHYNPTLVGKNLSKLELASPLVSIIYLNRDKDKYHENKRKITKLKKKFDVCIECSGSLSGLRMASMVVKSKGKIILKTTTAININPSENKEKIEILKDLTSKQIQIYGSRCGTFEPAIKLLENKIINVQPMISGVYPMKYIVEAFRRAEEKETIKVQILLST